MRSSIRIGSAVALGIIACAAITSRAGDPPAPKLPQGVPVDELNRFGNPAYVLLGKTHEPLGKVLDLEGFIVDEPGKGSDDGPNIRVQRINGRPTQEYVQIHLQDALPEFPSLPIVPKVETGKTYKLRGYETGGYLGIPSAALKEMGTFSQFSNHHFYTEFIFYRTTRIKPIEFAPSDFIDHAARIEGRAMTVAGKGCIQRGDWSLLVRADAPWPDWMEGKSVEARGVIRRGPDARTFRMENGEGRLVKLEDQVGREVELRGTLYQRHKHWLMSYRGETLYVDDLEKLPRLDTEEFWGPVAIRGTLYRDQRPDESKFGIEEDPDMKEYFVVRSRSWQPTDALLSPEKAD